RLDIPNGTQPRCHNVAGTCVAGIGCAVERTADHLLSRGLRRGDDCGELGMNGPGELDQSADRCIANQLGGLGRIVRLQEPIFQERFYDLICDGVLFFAVVAFALPMTTPTVHSTWLAVESTAELRNVVPP